MNRVSLGGQSLDAATLASLDRDHLPDDVRRAVDRLLSAACTVSVDLMIAAPGQSLAAVERDLEAVKSLGVQHVSVYCLTWEKGTNFDSLRQKGMLHRAEESLECDMFEATRGGRFRTLRSFKLRSGRLSLPPQRGLLGLSAVGGIRSWGGPV